VHLLLQLNQIFGGAAACPLILAALPLAGPGYCLKLVASVVPLDLRGKSLLLPKLSFLCLAMLLELDYLDSRHIVHFFAERCRAFLSVYQGYVDLALLVIAGPKSADTPLASLAWRSPSSAGRDRFDQTA
tara:strand:- start:56 stop:445 length:390 start_codon:yes stop_codon:yes gene_type:complete